MLNSVMFAMASAEFLVELRLMLTYNSLQFKDFKYQGSCMPSFDDVLPDVLEV